MKLKNLFVFPIIALAVSACAGSSEDAAIGAKPTTQTSISSSSPTNTVPTTPAPPPPTNCPAYPSRQFYPYYKEGTGTGSVTTTNEIIADQKLRVAIQPGSAWGTGTNNKNYSKMAMTVSLLRNGIVIASKALPAQNSGYKQGITVGTQSDPALLDFSSSLYGTATYSIRISNVNHNYKCGTSCTPSMFQCSYPMDKCINYNYLGYNFNYDYLSGNWYCCAGQLLQQCQALNCGVGPLAGLTNANWSVNIKVETDSTTCIQ